MAQVAVTYSHLACAAAEKTKNRKRARAGYHERGRYLRRWGPTDLDVPLSDGDRHGVRYADYKYLSGERAADAPRTACGPTVTAETQRERRAATGSGTDDTGPYHLNAVSVNVRTTSARSQPGWQPEAVKLAHGVHTSFARGFRISIRQIPKLLHRFRLCGGWPDIFGG